MYYWYARTSCIPSIFESDKLHHLFGIDDINIAGAPAARLRTHQTVGEDRGRQREVRTVPVPYVRDAFSSWLLSLVARIRMRWGGGQKRGSVGQLWRAYTIYINI